MRTQLLVSALFFAIVLIFIPLSITQIAEGLHCENNLCKCNETASIYSDTLEDPQCVGRAGSSCINSECTNNATCSSQNTCICNAAYFVDDRGLCIPKVKALGNCTEDLQCEQMEGQKLVCSNGICDCDPNVSMYSTARASQKASDRIQSFWIHNAEFQGFTGSNLTQCVGRIGSPCIDRLCVPNSFCSFPTDQNAINQQDTCKCKSGFSESKSHTCDVGYGFACSSSSPCVEGLTCVDSKCRCLYDTQTYNSSTNLCLSQVGGPCNDSSSCQSQAECTLSTKRSGSISGAGHCACKSGFVESLNGKCEAAYDTHCSSSADCDSVAGLQCIYKKCKCWKFALFDSVIRKCVGLVGAKCNLKEGDECIANAFCKGTKVRPLPGTCTCNPGFEETENYECEPEKNVQKAKQKCQQKTAPKN